jgi:hypothetical protein
MKATVHGLLSSAPQVTSVVEELQTRGFSDSEISVLFPDSLDLAGRACISRAPQVAAAGGAAGAGLGAMLGFLVGLGVLGIPGIGALLVAGPLVAALSGAAVGGAAGGIIGGLVGLGHRSVAGARVRRRASRAPAREILISVHGADSRARARARRILLESGARHVGS